MSQNGLEQRAARLRALEHACATRRAILACVEATFGVVSALGERPEGAESSDTGRQARALLRERDELALLILRVQHEIDQVREQRIVQAERTAGARFHAINALQTAKEVRDAGAIHAQQPFEGASGPSAGPATGPEQRLDLLKGVLAGLAMQCENPWWEDPDLVPLLLDEPGESDAA